MCCYHGNVRGFLRQTIFVMALYCNSCHFARLTNVKLILLFVLFVILNFCSKNVHVYSMYLGVFIQ